MNCNRITTKEVDKSQLSNICLVLSAPSVGGWIQAEIWANCEIISKRLYLIDGRETKNSIAKYLFLRFFSSDESLRILLEENDTLIVIYLDNANRKHYYERCYN